MRDQTLRARSLSGHGHPDLIANGGFLLMALASVALAILVFVRHAHTQLGGHGYWTDALGFRAGVDNVGVRTLFTIFSNADLHWQHNLLVLGSLIGFACGFALKLSGRRTAGRERSYT